jgi:hypothetical protein
MRRRRGGAVPRADEEEARGSWCAPARAPLLARLLPWVVNLKEPRELRASAVRLYGRFCRIGYALLSDNRCGASSCGARVVGCAALLLCGLVAVRPCCCAALLLCGPVAGCCCLLLHCLRRPRQTRTHRTAAFLFGAPRPADSDLSQAQVARLVRFAGRRTLLIHTRSAWAHGQAIP